MLEEEKTEQEKPQDDQEMEPAAAAEEQAGGERETDAPEDTRAKIKADAAQLNLTDSTLNVMPVSNGKMVMTLVDGGFQYLLAGSRSTVGLKSGRYMFEVTIVETINLQEVRGQKGPQPRQLVRIGLSAGGSSLFLGDGIEGVCFDSEGYFTSDGRGRKAGCKFGRDQTVALLLNLDASSKNASTVSLFVNGQRSSDPIPLPENLVGKTLFPTVTYRNVTLQVNFGPTPKAKLPFVCRMVSDAAAADAEVAPAQDGKCEVLFPVGLPDQGYFDWVDLFLKKNPSYTELSDRKIFDWAEKSGLWRARAAGQGDSNDKPEPKFGIPMLDDFSLRKVLSTIAPAVKRNYIVPELASNLLAADRKQAVQSFPSSDFKRTSLVVMGEPESGYRDYVHGLLLEEKKAQVQHDDKWASSRRKGPAEGIRPKASVSEDTKEDGEEKKEEDAEMKDAKDGEEGEKEEEKKEEKEEEEEEKKEVELSEEEKKANFRKAQLPDVNEKVLSKSYASFSLPSAADGFDAVTFAWQDADACAKHLKSWVLEKKLTQRAEDLQPGEWFKDEWQKWQKIYQDWRRVQSDWKDPAKRKSLIARKKGGDAKEEDEGADKKEDEEKKDEEMEINAEDVEVSTVKDICDLGNGEPLFSNFVYEDWALLSTRYEMHLLVHAFRKDLNDTDRPSFSETHLAFYYNKYFKKVFNTKYFGVESFADFIDLIKDAIALDEKTNFLKTVLGEETPMEDFVKYTEDHRRERQQRIDAGDETAKLKFSRPAAMPPTSEGAHGGHHSGGSRHSASASHHSGGGGGGSYRSGGGSGGGGSHHGGGGGSRGPPPARASHQSGGGGGSRPAYGGPSSARGQPEKRPYPGGSGGGGGGSSYGAPSKGARVGGASGGGYGGRGKGGGSGGSGYGRR